MAEKTAPKSYNPTAWITVRYVIFWRVVYGIQTASFKNILAWGEIGMAAVIAFFPGRNAVTAAADGKPGGLVIAGLLILWFAVCGGGLLAQQKVSDRGMKIGLSPIFILWCLMFVSVSASLAGGAAGTGGTLLVFIIVSMLMLMGMSYTYSPSRERP